MRRLFVAVSLCAAFFLLAAPALAGLTVHPGHGKAVPAAHVPRRFAPSSRSFSPLGARLSGSVTVSGRVYDSSHATLGNVSMKWWSWSEPAQRWYNGSMTSRGGGSYSASPQPTGDGEIWAYPDADTALGRLGQTWSAGNAYSNVDLYPGRVTISATRDGLWKDFDSLTLNLWGEQAFSSGSQTISDTTLDPATVQAEALDGVYSSGSVNFWPDEGVEFSTPLTVTSGTTSSGTISVSELSAQRVQFSGYGFSGKPGATVKVSRVNFPAGWRNYVTGSSDPSGTAYKEYGTRVSQGAVSEPLSIKVPSTARPGYSYWIGFHHVAANGDSAPMYVETAYQVCTIQPSMASVARRTRIRVSGIVPTQGHWGDKMGRRKAIVLWWHKGTAPVPATWDPREKGWVEVTSLMTTGTGSYLTPYFKVARTGTFVVQYDSDDWYSGGYTSTAKVRVR